MSRSTAYAVVFALLIAGMVGCSPTALAPQARPNIVLIMTDDQGWAQLGSHGDDVLQTPHLDRLAEESVEFTRFYVSPVCAPTRASLMTGRYNYRTGVVDTWLGRAMMAPDETTVAELLSREGYRTGIFGKWHLGDNYPMRTIDQGFAQSVVHRGGGIGQASDPPGSDYFDPILFRNGREEKFAGYCTDVYFDEALAFIESADARPFFVYLPTNAPHSPYLVPDEYRIPYEAQGLNDKDARIYGMITNIDDNVGRLTAALEARGLADNTLLIFMTDNGPTTRRYAAGLRDQKTTVYEGGIRVPFLLRWPERFEPRKVDTIAAHIDVTPTLLEAAGAAQPADLALDGRSLMPLLDGASDEGWPQRTLYFQSHRGDEPQLYRAFAAVEQRWKLAQPLSFRQPAPPDAPLALYDLEADPGEQHDAAAEHPEIVNRMKQAYEQWFADVSATRGYAPQRIAVGAAQQAEVVLTRQDWRVVDGANSGNKLGLWEVEVLDPGPYQIVVSVKPREAAGEIELRIGGLERTAAFSPGDEQIAFGALELPTGAQQVRTRVRSGGVVEGAWFVTLRR